MLQVVEFLFTSEADVDGHCLSPAQTNTAHNGVKKNKGEASEGTDWPRFLAINFQQYCCNFSAVRLP